MSVVRAIVGGVALTVLGPIAAAAFIPVTADSPEVLFEIPKGTFARRMAGDPVEVLPSEIRLVTEIRNVLVLKNSDDVPHTFGVTLLMPGQNLRLTFSRPSENQFVCTAHASGSLMIRVEEAPTTPWARLGWRTHELFASKR